HGKDIIEQIREIIPAEIDLYFYRIHNGAECDLVLVKGLQPISAIEDLATSDNYIITPYSETYDKSANIKVCSLIEYLNTFIIQ
ncbi:MAG: hypothetical protein KAT15_21330, partial [Bacteroidales bacterium]|nr:hypothetical protein [Bacteroidales bacterium]